MISNDVSVLEELHSYFVQKCLQKKELKRLPQQGVHHSNKTIVFLFEDFEHNVSVGQHLKYVTIFVYVRIEGIQIQPDQNDSERVGWTHVSELHGSEIKSSSGSTVLIPLELNTASGQACYVNGISKEKLLLQSSSTFNNLTFNFGIAFNKALAKVSGVQEGFTPMEKLCELKSLNDLLCLVANHTESNYGQDFLGAKSSFNSLFLPKNDKIRVKESFNADLIIELLKFSGQNEMKKLEEELLDFLTTKPIAWFTVDILQKLYFTSRNIERLEELTAFALTEMSRLSSETLTGCVYFKKLPQKDAISLLLAVLEWK